LRHPQKTIITGPNPFSLPKPAPKPAPTPVKPHVPVFTSKPKKYVQCKQVSIAASQVSWGLKQCQNKALSSQEKK